MAAKYEVWLCNDQGARIADAWGHTMLERMKSFTATRIANDVGTFTALVPPRFDQTLLRRDIIVQVWRNGKLFRPYFLRGWELKTRRGVTSLELQGLGVNDLLRRRIINRRIYEPGRLTPTDDLLKEIVSDSQAEGHEHRRNYGTRAWANFSVEEDAGAGQPIGDSFYGDEYRDWLLGLRYDYLLNKAGNGALQRIAESAESAGTAIFFDVVPLVISGKKMTLIFRVRIDQPGQDLTGHSVLFSQDRGNLKDCTLTYDYSKEENAIYAVGDLSMGGDITQSFSKPDHDASIWNRCEGMTRKDVMSGGAYVREHRGVIDFIGEVVDTSGMRYGRDWNFGDRVPVRYEHFQFDAVVKAVTFQVDRKGKEKIGARLEYQGDA